MLRNLRRNGQLRLHSIGSYLSFDRSLFGEGFYLSAAALHQNAREGFNNHRGYLPRQCRGLMQGLATGAFRSARKIYLRSKADMSLRNSRGSMLSIRCELIRLLMWRATQES